MNENELTGYEEHCRDSESNNTELQNSYELSRLETPLRNDQKKINTLVAQGRFVVFSSEAVYCSHTDALIGSHTTYLSDFATHDEAIVESSKYDADSEGDYAVGIAGPRPAITEVLPLFGDDNIPF